VYTIPDPSPSLRLRTSILETPQNIQVVTSDALRDQQVTSMSDGVIRNVSGAYRSEHWGDLYTNVMSRGAQVQAFRNGFNAVNSYWGPLTEDMSFVDHIEFVKGPAGFMLSNGDPSGLYNVVTKKPTGKTGGEVAITMGSYDFYRASLDLDGKLSQDGRLLYRLNVAGQNRKSHRANEFNNRYVIAPVISYQVDEKTKLTAEYTLQLANMSDVGSFYVFDTRGFATLPVNFTMLPVGMPATKIKDQSIFLNLQHDFNRDWKLTAQIARFDYKQDGTSMWPWAVNTDGTVTRGVGSWQAESQMTMAQLFLNGEFKTGSIRHRILAGIDLSNKSYLADWGQSHALDSVGGEFQLDHPNLGVPNNGYAQFDYSTPLAQRALAIGANIDQRYSSGYVQDELGLLDNRLRLTLAGRYTYVKQAYGPSPVSANKVTPRVGLSYSLTRSTSAYALYDQAFVPQSGQLSSGKDVQPITGNNIEFGLKREWSEGRWTTTLAFYRILKNNELTADPFAPPTSGLSVELGQKRSQGIEFDVRGSILPGLTATANYAFTDSKVTKVTEGVTSINKGDIVPGYARHTVNAWLGYSLQQGILKGFGVSAGFTMLSGRETYWDPSPDPNQVLPTYYKLDGGVFWENKSMRVALNVFNVLDEYLYSGSYYAYSGAYYWQTEAPRNFRMSVNYRF
jgi:iron complex outermembrane receptor protein